LVPKNGLLRGLLIFSLTLNAGLTLWLLRPFPRSATPKTSTGESATTAHPTLAATRGAAKPQNISAATLDWREVESADYRQYVTNLRAIGCPEQFVRDIIVADLNQLYAARARAVWAEPPIREFWQKSRPRIDPNQEQT